MGQIFLSHVEEDFGVVKEIADGLEREGYTTWCYEEQSVVGVPHMRLTRKAIDQAEAFLLLISSHALNSPRHIRREVYRAVNSDKPILPLLLEVTYDEFQERQPEWDDATAGAVAVSIPTDSPSAIVPRIIAGLKELGIQPERARIQEAEPEASSEPARPADVVADQPVEVGKLSREQVFVSYPIRDKETADAIVATLEAKGTQCWIAPRDFPSGVSGPDAITEAIDQTLLMVLVFSSRANESRHVARELERAASKGIPILSFRIEDVPPSRVMEYFISRAHWLDAFTPPLEEHLEHLAETVNVLLSTAGSREQLSAEPEALSKPARTAGGAVDRAVDQAVDAGQLSEEQVFEVAKDIVLRGPDAALKDILVERTGLWLSVDGTEIESIRSLKTLMAGYSSAERRDRPLSIALFGPPGSGKSFAMRQLAQTSLAEKDLRHLEFNLSQFGGPDDLPAAFHHIRDAVLEGKFPVVFWDEFDVSLGGQALGWLRHFLTPMQDGRFREGEVTHPLGRAIFVFAGGVYKSMQEFRSQEADPKLVEAKGLEFLSRLNGYIDILGANPRDPFDPEADKAYMLRRALWLRTILERNTQIDLSRPGAVDEGVVCAFLRVPQYKHGARSMEAVIQMSSLAGRAKFERSSLPEAHQLDLHVNAEDFLDLAGE